jgi:hypothetical protein
LSRAATRSFTRRQTEMMSLREPKLNAILRLLLKRGKCSRKEEKNQLYRKLKESGFSARLQAFCKA